MAIGFQTFIEGTSYDVLNSMDYNFIVDAFGVGEAGSRSYSYPGFTLSAFMTATGSSGRTQATVSVSGQTVSWSNAGQDARVYVSANANSTLNYFGFCLNDYATGKFKIAPNFTPMNLCQVVDLTPTALQVLRTNVPYGQPIVAFHRAMGGTEYNHVFFWYVNSGGYWGIRFRDSSIGTPMRATRVYVFSNVLVNAPQYGFFLYEPGGTNMVWHSNCLPLRMTVGSRDNSPVPLAITGGVSVVRSMPLDPGYPNGPGVTQSNCYSACQNSNGTWKADGGDLFLTRQYNSGSAGGSGISPPAYIETNIYDAYYRQSLGY